MGIISRELRRCGRSVAKGEEAGRWFSDLEGRNCWD